MKRALGLFALIASVLPWPGRAGFAAAQEEAAVREVSAITDVTVIPMDRDRALPGHTVIVRDGLIEWVGPAAEARIPAGARRIDGRGGYVIPGLSEMHAHIPGANAPGQLIEDILFLYVANGITTIRGMLGAPNQLALRERAARGELLSPAIIVGAPSLNGSSAPDPGTAIRLVREHAAAGYDFLKLHPGLSRETYDAIVEAARSEGITLGGHVSVAVGLHRTLEARQGTIDHLDGYLEAAIPETLLRRILSPADTVPMGVILRAVDPARVPALAGATRRAGVANVPTAALWEAFYSDEPPELMAARPEMRYVPRSMVDGWTRQKRQMAASQAAGGVGAEEVARLIGFRRALLGALADSGAVLLLGTDSPQMFSVPGFSLHREAALLQEAGLTPWQILESGTRNVGWYVREVLGADERVGLIAPGHRADLVLLRSDPRADVGHLRGIEGVMVRGRWLERAQLEAGLETIARRNAGG